MGLRRVAAVLLGLALLAAVASAREHDGSRAVAAAVTTTWTQVKSDCAKPPPGHGGTWVQKGNGCWDQQSAFGSWMVSDGSASVAQPTFTVGMTWSMPGSIAASGGQTSIAVMITGGVAERICVLGAYTSFQIEGGGDSCAQTSASMPSASATANLLPYDAANGTTGYVWVSLGDGGNLYYSYQASTPKPAPSLEIVPTPPAFGQTVAAPEPPPGSAAIATSPLLAMFGAVGAPVSVDVEGLSVRDQVIANVRHDCFVQFVKFIHGLAARRLITLADKTDMAPFTTDAARNGIRRGIADLAACLAFADAYAQQLYGRSAGLARAPCTDMSVKLSISGSGRHARLKSFHFGDPQAPLKVSCKRRAGGLTISVSTRSRHTPLSKVVGSRLRIAIVRAASDTTSGQLRITFTHR